MKFFCMIFISLSIYKLLECQTIPYHPKKLIANSNDVKEQYGRPPPYYMGRQQPYGHYPYQGQNYYGNQGQNYYGNQGYGNQGFYHLKLFFFRKLKILYFRLWTRTRLVPDNCWVSMEFIWQKMMNLINFRF